MIDIVFLKARSGPANTGGVLSQKRNFETQLCIDFWHWLTFNGERLESTKYQDVQELNTQSRRVTAADGFRSALGPRLSAGTFEKIMRPQAVDARKVATHQSREYFLPAVGTLGALPSRCGLIHWPGGRPE